MSPTSSATVSPDTAPLTHRIGFVGDSGVGKTTVATLVAARLAERTGVTATGDTAQIVGHCAHRDDALGIEWTVDDCPSGVDALNACADRLDTVFIVATPEMLNSVEAYADRAHYHGVDCFLVVNRFQESARDQLRAFEGPEPAEYIYDDADVSAAITAGRVPTLPERTVEAILIEALQPERLSTEQAVAALESGEHSIVNVEAESRNTAESVLNTFETAGFFAAYFDCNCRCHDGHVLARVAQG